MTDKQILDFLTAETNLNCRIENCFNDFLVLNFCGDKSNWIIDKSKRKSNGAKLRDFSENEMQAELKKRCAAIRRFYRQGIK